jgi:cytoskeletal protein CcmA (bactofilin family)
VFLDWKAFLECRKSQVLQSLSKALLCVNIAASIPLLRRNGPHRQFHSQKQQEKAMFQRSKKIAQEEDMTKKSDEIQGFFGKGTELQGELKFDGTVRIDGTFRGSIHTVGVLLVGEEARVEADVHCGTIIVTGEITGEIQATERFEAQAPAKIQGNVEAPVLVISEGVHFDGHAKMGSPVGAKAEMGKRIIPPGKPKPSKSNDETLQEQLNLDPSEQPKDSPAAG